MLNDKELAMLAKVGFMVASAISILNGLYCISRADYTASIVPISLGIVFFCVGLVQILNSD
jgi:uncharacterized membrane protein HdeD (DUF308 family)